MRQYDVNTKKKPVVCEDLTTYDIYPIRLIEKCCFSKNELQHS